MNQSTLKTARKTTNIHHISGTLVGTNVLLRARIHASRPTGAKMLFVTLRQKTDTVQSILTVDGSKISKQMLKFASSITNESLVLVEATVLAVPKLVTSCTVQDVELQIQTIHLESESARLPFNIEDAQRPIADITDDSGFCEIKLDTRLNNRVIDLRTTTNHAIFRIQAGICRLFREYLDSLNFIEIHTPKLLGAASEGGANVFKVTYFKESAFLAQSPQLYKQMLICSDFERVYEIAPVFRAEDSNTHRHMTEFMGKNRLNLGLDLEMAFQDHYHEVLDVLGGLFTHIFKSLRTQYKDELAAVHKQYPFEEFQFLEKPLILEFSEGIKMLREAGVTIGDFDDLNTESERLLGKLVKEKYHTDFFMLDKFPLAIRPFYTMPDPNLPVNDFFYLGIQ